MKTCCFTGHRNIKVNDILLTRLNVVLISLIQNGVTDFYAGGALGWDILCEKSVINLRKKYPHIRLHLILPCSNQEQTEKWTDMERSAFYEILNLADSVEYTSKHYSANCMKIRNERLVMSSDFCVCYYNENRKRSGTGQTVRMAEVKCSKIINLFE